VEDHFKYWDRLIKKYCEIEDFPDKREAELNIWSNIAVVQYPGTPIDQRVSIYMNLAMLDWLLVDKGYIQKGESLQHHPAKVSIPPKLMAEIKERMTVQALEDGAIHKSEFAEA